MSLTHKNQQGFNDLKDLSEEIVGIILENLLNYTRFLRLSSLKKSNCWNTATS